MSPIAGEPRRRTGRPRPGEYADCASVYIAAVPGDAAIDALAQLAAQTPTFFRAIAEAAEGGPHVLPGEMDAQGDSRAHGGR
jgi:hypothetical protein